MKTQREGRDQYCRYFSRYCEIVHRLANVRVNGRPATDSSEEMPAVQLRSY